MNAAEHGQALVISGSSTGGEAGDVVTVTLNSKTYTTTLDASGNWSVGVPAVGCHCAGQRSANHHCGHYRCALATAMTPAARSPLIFAAPTIGINTIASDDVINASGKRRGPANYRHQQSARRHHHYGDAERAKLHRHHRCFRQLERHGASLGSLAHWVKLTTR
ncbi:hypothetical protein [Escherichia coli]|uniref:hypothetical protein n=1 Tax=Escherichia coli TaxID=562 RepID=UPI003CC91F1A